MFIKNGWYVAATGSDITAQPVRRLICNEPIALFRTEDGQAIALADRCIFTGACPCPKDASSATASNAAITGLNMTAPGPAFMSPARTAFRGVPPFTAIR